MVRGDVTQFDEVMAVVLEVKADQLINLSYYIGSDLPPRVATKLNVLGMDNCFEAARLCGVKRVVYASSLTVYGEQLNFGERPVVEADFLHGENAVRRLQDLQRAPGRVVQRRVWHADHGSARGKRDWLGQGARLHRPRQVHHRAGARSPVEFPYRDAMRLPIHVADVAECFSRLVDGQAADTPCTTRAAMASAWATWPRW